MCLHMGHKWVVLALRVHIAARAVEGQGVRGRRRASGRAQKILECTARSRRVLGALASISAEVVAPQVAHTAASLGSGTRTSQTRLTLIYSHLTGSMNDSISPAASSVFFATAPDISAGDVYMEQDICYGECLEPSVCTACASSTLTVLYCELHGLD